MVMVGNNAAQPVETREPNVSYVHYGGKKIVSIVKNTAEKQAMMRKDLWYYNSNRSVFQLLFNL